MAGKRAGLKHSVNGDDETTRSGLFMEAVRIIKEMRKATNGKYPKYAIWENVMGAFSSNAGNDFRVVLEELIKICEPQAPEIPSPGKAGWPYADCIVGDGWSLAYRVFDAQYWPGTPQRRKRIYLVLNLTDERAEKILFERPGLLGHHEESRTSRQEAAGDSQGSSGADNPESCIIAIDQQGGKGSSNFAVDVMPTLCSDSHGTPHAVAYGVTSKGNGDSFISKERHTAIATGGGQPGQGYPCVMQPIAVATQQGGAEISENGICPTITAAAGMSGNNQPWTVYSISSYDSNAMKSSNPHSGIYEAATSRTLDLNGGYPATNQGGIVIVDQIAGQGEYYQESNVSSTLRAGGLGAVSYCMTTGSYMQVAEEVSPTLMARDYKDPNCVCSEYIVRRLTPTECARLQGFPDRWGDIPQKETLTDEEYSFWLNVRNTHAAINGRATKEYTKDQILKWYNKLHSDSSEYKMWGNGIALPNALYVMQGIADANTHS